MAKYGYLVVEGPHDVEFVYRLLSPFGFARVQMESDLDAFFQPLIPRKFPHGGDLQKRVPVPLFLQNSTHAIALHSAIGDSRLVETVEENSVAIDYQDVTGIGIILDTDKEVPASDRYAAIKNEMSKKGYALPGSPGTVAGSNPRLGAFVLPDNASQGNLEDVLLECATAAFPNLLASAQTHVTNALNDNSFKDDRREDLGKTPKFNKALVGAIATTLRPGRAVQTSIQDNIWLRGNNLNLPKVKAVQEFLVDLLELNQP